MIAAFRNGNQAKTKIIAHVANKISYKRQKDTSRYVGLLKWLGIRFDFFFVYFVIV